MNRMSLHTLRLAAVVLVAMLLGTTTARTAGAQTQTQTQKTQTQTQSRPTNVILFISDGTGPATFTMGRDYLRYTGEDSTLAVDDILVGSIQTYSTSARVTDSAAGATAFAAGVKTYNGAIGVDTLQQPVTTLLEAAEEKGMRTGLVATSRITHATPAAFAAHVPQRSMEAEIASQMMEQDIDVIFGGGRDYFVPEADGGLRDDGRDLLAEARRQGYDVVASRDAFDDVTGAPVLALFAGSHMAYEIDRDPTDEPSLAEMTQKALDLLSTNSNDADQSDADRQGFFLMVEGSRIDHAGHSNDAAAHLHEVLAFDDAVAVAKAFAAENGHTLVVSTSDHETGGLTLGRRLDGRSIYDWRPEVLEGIRASLDVIGDEMSKGLEPPCDVLQDYTAMTCTAEEEQRYADALQQDASLEAVTADLVARRALLGWTTGGHTAVDVNLYAFGPGADEFRGHHDNTYIGREIARLLGLRIGAVTTEAGTAAGASQ